MNSNILKLEAQDKLDHGDLVHLTKMEVTLPIRAQILKHNIKNLAGLAGRCLGQTSLLHVGLTDLAEHVEGKENAYNYEFHQERLFGRTFWTESIGAFSTFSTLAHQGMAQRCGNN